MTKHIFFIFWILYYFAISSCIKSELTTPIFDVSIDSTTYKKGDAVQFNFSGNADIITFYSGVNGNKYEYRKRINSIKDSVLFSFTSSVNTPGSGNLEMLLSQDFSGVYNKEEIAKATWVDFTPSLTIATTNIATNSQTLCLNDFQSPNTPTYLAFKYSANGMAVQKKYTIANIALEHKVDSITSFTLLNASTSASSLGWLSTKILSDTIWKAKTATSSNAEFSITGSTVLNNSTGIETWLISGGVVLTKTDPDIGIAIKKIEDNSLLFYRYQYVEAGEYDVTFVSKNSNINGMSDEIIRKLHITVK